MVYHVFAVIKFVFLCYFMCIYEIFKVYLLICLFQLRILASDGGTPPLRSTATATITVERNLNSPEFRTSRYNVNVRENEILGKTLTTLNATDDDIVAPHNVLHFSISEQSEFASYFLIDSSTGALSLSRSLLDTEGDEIEVRTTKLILCLI